MTAAMDQVPVFKPLLESEEFVAAERSLRMGWLGMGSYVARFESELAKLIEAPDLHVAAVSTGHAALHLSLVLAGVGAGDEVITAAFNNVADFQAILATGAEPVFCDVDESTLCIDPSIAEELLSSRTKAIIAMDYACHLCDHVKIASLAERRGLRVIHDAAHSLGSRFQGRAVGSFSDLTVFSFDPVKTITAIDGGAVVVRSRDELSALHEMRLIGMGQPASQIYQNKRAWTYDVARLGFRYHMANLHAAIGLAQLGKFDQIAATRRAAFDRYSFALSGCTGLVLPKTDMASVVPLIYYLRVLDGRREELRAHLASKGIDTGIHWQPGHRFSLFRECRRGDLKRTEKIAAEILTIPLHARMAQQDQDRTIDAITEFFA